MIKEMTTDEWIDRLLAQNESLRRIIGDRIMDDKAWQQEYEEWLAKIEKMDEYERKGE